MDKVVNNTRLPRNVVKQRLEKRDAYIKSNEHLAPIIQSYSEYLYFSESFKNVSLKTASQYMRVTRDMLVFLFECEELSNISKKQLDKVTIDDLNRFLMYYNAGIKTFGTIDKEIMNQPITINNYQSAIRKFFKWAYNKEHVSENVSQKLEIKKETEDHRVVTLNMDEVTAVIHLIENGKTLYSERQISLTKKQLEWHEKNKKRDRAIFQLMLYHGLRIEEVHNLNIENFDFISKEFSGLRKRNKIVTFYMNDDTIEVIKDYLNNERPDSEDSSLFLSNHGEIIKRFSIEQIRKTITRYMKLINPNKKLSPHKIRATFGTKVANDYHDIRVAQLLLDHKHSSSTERYINDDEERKKEVSRAIRF